MHIIFKSSYSGNRGYALIITMIFLAVCLLIFGSMMSWVSTNAKINQRNNQYNMSQAVAEAATERVLGQMESDFLIQRLTNASWYASLTLSTNMQTNYDGTPWPVRYIISDASGYAGQITVSHGNQGITLEPLGSQYANLKGYPWLWTNIAVATPIGQPYTVPASLTQVINFSSVPIFQYAIFYNINLEIDPGAPMFINGSVWSNAGLWAGTGNLTFNSTVSAVNEADISGIDPFATNKTDSGGAHFNLPNQPKGHNTALTMPIAGATNSNPTNVESILNIPPNTVALPYGMGSDNAYTTEGLQYIANGADLIISNSATGTNWGSLPPKGTNITIYYQDQTSPANYLQKLTPDFYILKSPAKTGYYTNYVSQNLSDTNRCYTNVSYAGWSFVTNVAFYDYREQNMIQAVQIDVGQFNIWFTNSITNNNGGGPYNSTCIANKTHRLDSMWVYNKVTNSSTILPAVRVVNGIQLPSSDGFTVVTPMPIYVYGDYNKRTDSTHVSYLTNTLNTYPAALMGDAITVLSSSWSDSYSLTHTNDSNPNARNASDTVVNAACLEGIVQSAGSQYSGGVENFIRYLENWDNNTSTYNGSIVVMFPSIYATNSWSYGSYYTAPGRNWGFDVNFLDQTKLPPLTPSLKKTVRVSWNAQ